MYPHDSLQHWHRGQGLWADVPAENWNSWKWQLQHRIKSLEDVEAHLELTPDERAGCLFANKKLALAITPYFFNLIDREDPDCPIRRQVIPRSGEMATVHSAPPPFCCIATPKPACSMPLLRRPCIGGLRHVFAGGTQAVRAIRRHLLAEP